MVPVRSNDQAMKVFLENMEYVRRIARINAPQTDMVEDVVNETFVVFMSGLEKWNLSSPGIRGLLGVLARQSAFRIRHANRTMNQEQAKRIYEILSKQATWVSENIYEEEKACLLEIMKNLIPRHQELLRLYYFEKMSIREVAKRLGIKEENACRIMSRLRVRLRKKIEERLGRRGEP